MKRTLFTAAVLLGCNFLLEAQELNPLDMRWTFGAHEPYTMYRRIGRKSTGGIDGNAEWVKPWLDWFDSESPAVMQELGLNWQHCRFYKGMGWEVEKEDFPNVKKFVANCHAHGVHVLAYVQAGTLYPEIMQAEIPNVMDWAQINADGKPNIYTHTQYFRYMPCINCAEWEEYIKRMCTIALTEGGFDGIMFDNFFTYDCCCKECEKRFTEYLESLPDKEERFGFKDVSGMHIPKYAGSSYFKGEIRDPVVQAWLEWRYKSMTALMQRFADHIHSVKADAVVSANICSPRRIGMASESGTNLVDLVKVMDLTVGQSLHYPGVKDGMITSRIRELKLARDLGKPDVALCDTDAMITEEQEKHYLLPLYEDLVFGGVPTDRTILSPKPVPGFLDREKLERRKPQLAAFNAMVRERRADFEAPVYAPVRILYPNEELIFSWPSSEAICAAEEILNRRQIPWGYLVSTESDPFTVPDGTQLIIVPGLTALSDAQVEGLVKWAQAGGKLVITGDSGRYNRFNGQRFVNPLLTRVSGLPGVSVRKTVDRVSPAYLEFDMQVGIPADHGDALLSDIAGTGFKLPFEIKGCPETVAVDVRKTDSGYVLHFINYMPSSPVKTLRVRGADGRTVKVPSFSEYISVKI